MNKWIMGLVFALSTLSAFSVEFVSTNVYAVAQTEEIAQQQFLNCADLDFNGCALRDQFWLISNTNETVNGHFDRDLWVAGIALEFAGTSDDDVRIVTQGRASVSGAIASDLWAIGASIELLESSVVSNSVWLVGKNVLMKGTVRGDAKVTGNQVTLGGEIVGDVHIVADSVVFLNGTRIGGTVYYAGPQFLVPNDTVTIVGGIKPLTVQKPTGSWKSRAYAQFYLWASAVLVLLSWMNLFPIQSGTSAAILRTNPMRCLLVGALGMIVIPVIGFLFISSLIGGALAGLILVIYGVMLYMGKFVVALMVGVGLVTRIRASNRRMASPVGLTILVLLVYYALGIIPGFAVPLSLGVACYGMGAMLIMITRQRRMIARMAPPPAPSSDAEENVTDKEEL